MSMPQAPARQDLKTITTWERENFISSLDRRDEDGDGYDYTRKVEDTIGVRIDGNCLENDYFRICGRTTLQGGLNQNPYTKMYHNRKEVRPTRDGFDQVFAIDRLTRALGHLQNIGIDIRTFPRLNKSNADVIQVKINQGSECNAWYNRDDKDLTFATCENMNTASDGDMVLHEFGHLILDHKNSMLLDPNNYLPPSPYGRHYYQGEQYAIHEGFADAFAALINRNPVISEDSYVFTGRKKLEGMRSVENQIKRSETTSESHDRGRVYGGFFWSMTQAIEKLLPAKGRSLEKAQDMSLLLLLEHPVFFKQGRVGTKEFVEAYLQAAQALIVTGKLPISQPNALYGSIIAGARERALITDKEVGQLGAQYRKGVPLGLMSSSTSIAAVRARFKGNKQISFVKSVENVTPSGRHLFRQQYYRTKAGKRIKVLGHGLVQHKLRIKGFGISDNEMVSMEGVRELANIQEGNLSAGAAKALLYKALRTRLNEYERASGAGDGHDWITRHRFDRDLHALKEAFRKSSGVGAGDFRLVLPSQKTEVCYQVNLGGITVQINRTTKAVDFVRNYVVD
jgi:hypothetical protein